MTSAHLSQSAEGRTRRESRDTWSGFLAIDNYEHVTERIRRLIGNGQRYTWASTNDGFSWESSIGFDVRTGQVAESVSAECKPLDDGTPMAHITVCDTYGVWGMGSTAATEAKARELPERQRTYVRFGESFGRRDVLTIRQFAPAGHGLVWKIVPELA